MTCVLTFVPVVFTGRTSVGAPLASLLWKSGQGILGWMPSCDVFALSKQMLAATFVSVSLDSIGFVQ